MHLPRKQVLIQPLGLPGRKAALWRRFAKKLSPVLAHRYSRILLELQAVICSDIASFAAFWPVIGQ